MEGTGGARGRWGTALALLGAVLLLAAFHPVPLVSLPLAVVLLAVPFAPRWRWIATGLLLWLFGISVPVGPLGELSRGWGSLLGGGLLAATLWRPRWAVFPRALLALGMALAGGLAWLAATSGLGPADARVHEHLDALSAQMVARMRTQGAEPELVEQFAAAATEMMRVVWELFPGFAALQSVAALALVCWLVGRLGGGDGSAFALQPLRAFRFHDQLVWILIAGLLLVLVPMDGPAGRIGSNLLLFMVALYALRGVGIFVSLIGAAPTGVALVVAVLTIGSFLSPLVFSAVLLAGLADTWVDLRARASVSPRS